MHRRAAQRLEQLGASPVTAPKLIGV